jgi:hypothetical protein
VHRAFSDVGGHVVLGTPKLHQSRTVPIPPFLAREVATVITGESADDLAFTLPGGTVLRLSNWRQATFHHRPRPGRDQQPVSHSRPAAHRRLTDDPGGFSAEDAAGDHGARQYHHDS